MNKKIGIPGWKTGDNSFGVTITYLDFISKFGDPVILLPNDEIMDIDLLILPGGLDLHPSNYNEVPNWYTSNSDVFKEHFFRNKLPDYILNSTPIYGICLGFQALGVIFKSKLTQNLRYHAQSDSRWSTAHKVVPLLEQATKPKIKDGFSVNSHHHQGIISSNLGKDLVPLLYSQNEENLNDPIVEAFKHDSLPIYGAQWHPEELYDEFSIETINFLLE